MTIVAEAEAMTTRHGGRSLWCTCRRRPRSSTAESDPRLCENAPQGIMAKSDWVFAQGPKLEVTRGR
jgi:hypothetical protein